MAEPKTMENDVAERAYAAATEHNADARARRRPGPPGVTRDDINNWFTYHPPKGSQVTRYEIIREEFRAMALIIRDLTPQCADQTAAFRKLRETAMAVNQCIACNEDPDADES